MIPFTTPITTASGDQTYSLAISKGTVITSHIQYMNRAEVFWGANSKEFEPERWLEGGDRAKAEEIHGYRHTLTFSDGPRSCLGKSFALTQFKVRSVRGFGRCTRRLADSECSLSFAS